MGSKESMEGVYIFVYIRHENMYRVGVNRSDVGLIYLFIESALSGLKWHPYPKYFR